MCWPFARWQPRRPSPNRGRRRKPYHAVGGSAIFYGNRMPMRGDILWGFSLVVSLFALVVAGYLVRDVWRQDSSTAQMQAIADAICEGARAEH